MVNQSSIKDVNLINEDIILKALNQMKAGKSDVMYDFSTDCFLKGPPELLTHVVNCLKTFLIHGYVPTFLLVCSLIPIVKDSYGDLSSSSNYRAVAIGSIVLKILDWVLLFLQGDKLSTDELQFGFKTMLSTTMCTWTLSTVVEHFNSRGRTVFGAAMDCSKAFDVCSWVYLFSELLEKGISPIFLRLLIFTYQTGVEIILKNFQCSMECVRGPSQAPFSSQYI